MRPHHASLPLVLATLTTVLLTSTPAAAVGEGGTYGDAKGEEISAATSRSRIKLTQVSGPTGGKRGSLSSTDVNWEPPPCWYEPLFTPEQLKNFAETDGSGQVSIRQGWIGSKLWTDHFRDENDAPNHFGTPSTTKGYKDYNLGKDGYFWHGVAPDVTTIDDTSLCGRLMFWQNAGEIPDDPNAPTPETLADYAYDKVKVPDTEVELKPETESTVNLPTWVWLDKGTFQEVKVRAELPGTNLWAETTAKPVSLHLVPGTGDAETYPPPASARSTKTARSAPRTRRATPSRRLPAASRTCAPPAASPTRSRPPSPGRSPGKAPAVPVATCPTAPSRPPRT